MKKWLSWTKLKNLINTKKIGYQYIQYSTYYYIFIIEGNIEYFTELWTNTDSIEGLDVDTNNTNLQEFIDNYKDLANKKAVAESPFLHAENNENIEFFSNISGINSGNYTELINLTVPSDKIYYITDLIPSATKDGIFRMKLNGQVACMMYYGARASVNCNRTSPNKINSDTIFSIEYKPDTDGADASVSIGGYQI